jgi:hypothetical protein
MGGLMKNNGMPSRPAPKKGHPDFRNAPDLMITWNDLIKVEAIEQLPLVRIEPPHHRPISQKAASPRPNHGSAASKRLLQQNRSQAVFRVSGRDGSSTPTCEH